MCAFQGSCGGSVKRSAACNKSLGDNTVTGGFTSSKRCEQARIMQSSQHRSSPSSRHTHQGSSGFVVEQCLAVGRELRVHHCPDATTDVVTQRLTVLHALGGLLRLPDQLVVNNVVVHKCVGSFIASIGLIHLVVDSCLGSRPLAVVGGLRGMEWMLGSHYS